MHCLVRTPIGCVFVCECVVSEIWPKTPSPLVKVICVLENNKNVSLSTYSTTLFAVTSRYFSSPSLSLCPCLVRKRRLSWPALIQHILQQHSLKILLCHFIACYGGGGWMTDIQQQSPGFWTSASHVHTFCLCSAWIQLLFLWYCNHEKDGI